MEEENKGKRRKRYLREMMKDIALERKMLLIEWRKLKVELNGLTAEEK